jgi:hypothetical protein
MKRFRWGRRSPAFRLSAGGDFRLAVDRRCGGEYASGAVKEAALVLVARFLALLACLPLFVPTGVCLCGVGESAACPVSSCCDDDCCDESQESPPAPNDDHQRGCPDGQAIDAVNGFGSQTALHVDLAPLTVAEFRKTSDDSVRFIRWRVEIGDSSSNRPLYLAHCALIL